MAEEVVGQGRAKPGQCVKTKKPDSFATYVAMITSVNSDGSLTVLFKGCDYSKKEEVILPHGHPYRCLTLKDMEFPCYSEADLEEIKTGLDACMSDEELEQLDREEGLAELHHRLRERAVPRFAQAFEFGDPGARFDQPRGDSGASDFVAWMWSAQKVLPPIVLNVDVKEQSLNRIVIGCTNMGGMEVATVEMEPSDSLRVLENAVKEQVDWRGRLQFISPDGSPIKDPEGRRTIIELLPGMLPSSP